MCDPEPRLPQAARILEVIRESERVKRFVLEARVEAEPGQFVMAWLPGVNEKPFSLAASEPLTVVVSQVGPFTAAMHQLCAGDWLWWRGPLGRGFTLPDKAEAGQSLLLVGGGYGVAPLSFLARRAAAAGWAVTAVIGAKTEGDLVLQEDLAALGCRVQLCTEDGSCGERGLATEAAARVLAEELGARTVYGCGPHGMLEALRTMCRAHRLPCQLSYEGLMKCGFGVCGSCAWQGLLICRDGPVLSWAADGRRVPA